MRAMQGILKGVTPLSGVSGAAPLTVPPPNEKEEKLMAKQIKYGEEARRSREADAERLGIKKNISDLEHMLGTTQMRIDEIISLLSEMAPEDNSYQKTVKALKDNFEYMNRMIKYSNSQICSEQMNLKEGDLSEYILGYADG